MDEFKEQNITQAPFERVNFNGDGSEFFKIWIVNLLLSIVTLGIYSAWAKVRARKYLFNKTKFRGHSFDYHARPLAILKGKILAAILVAIYFFGSSLNPMLGLFGFVLLTFSTPFFYVKSFQFNANNTSYQNIKFHFLGKVKEAYKIYFKYFGFPILLSIILVLLAAQIGFNERDLEESELASQMAATLGLIYGILFINLIYTLFIASRALNAILIFSYNNLYYGGTRINIRSSFKELSKAVVRPMLKLYGLAILVLIGMAFLAYLIMQMALRGQVQGQEGALTLVAIAITIVVLVFYLFIFYASMKFPYYMTTYVWNRLSIDNGESKQDLRWRDYFKLAVINLLLIGVTLGFYTPWAVIDMLALKWKHRLLKVDNLEDVKAMAKGRESALSEEMSEAFDFDFDIGL